MATDTDPGSPRAALDTVIEQLTVLIDRIERTAAETSTTADRIPAEPATALRAWVSDAERVRSRLQNHRKLLQARGALLSAETAAAQLPDRTPSPGPAAPTRDSPEETPLIHPAYPGMPEGDDWLDHPPAGVRDGRGGFELRLFRELAAVGVRSYSLSVLTKFPDMPAAVPIVADWLTHLDERVPGPEAFGVLGSPEEHKAVLRADLIRNLAKRSARGNPAIIDLLSTQLRRTPPLRFDVRFHAATAIADLARPTDFDLVATLLDEQPPGEQTRNALLTYIARQGDPRARDIAAAHLHHPDTRAAAIDALTRLRAPDATPLIEPYRNDPDPYVRQRAIRALEKLSR
ncbi:HEAT repeat domain-containing protein [Nocardia sp. NPDC057227]|uniref:HEAT repeat domain-containing protein n=1 Tax=Nocardia sp. NPDC057227 TaxID=3346056 RepID=UPI00363563BC